MLMFLVVRYFTKSASNDMDPSQAEYCHHCRGYQRHWKYRCLMWYQLDNLSSQSRSRYSERMVLRRSWLKKKTLQNDRSSRAWHSSIGHTVSLQLYHIHPLSDVTIIFMKYLDSMSICMVEILDFKNFECNYVHFLWFIPSHSKDYRLY